MPLERNRSTVGKTANSLISPRRQQLTPLPCGGPARLDPSLEPGPDPGMVQILGYSGNSTDRPHASTVGIRSVVGPIAGSGTLEAVPAQPVEPVRVRFNAVKHFTLLVDQPKSRAPFSSALSWPLG